jgi:hypothetical protein
MTNREKFIELCKSERVLKVVNFPLGEVHVNDKFARFMDSDTDSAWLGFQLGLYSAQQHFHILSESSDGVIGLTSTVAGQLISIRDELAKGDAQEAYHLLYGIADPNYTNLEPWAKLENIAKGLKPNEQTRT